MFASILLSFKSDTMELPDEFSSCNYDLDADNADSKSETGNYRNPHTTPVWRYIGIPSPEINFGLFILICWSMLIIFTHSAASLQKPYRRSSQGFSLRQEKKKSLLLHYICHQSLTQVL